MAILMAASALLAGCSKVNLDREMVALCRTDGGVKVYERQLLPPTEFDQSGNKRLYRTGTTAERETLLGPDFRYVEAFTTVAGARGNEWKGHVVRFSIKVFRKSDNKLLGESTSYSRIGGDGLSTLWNWQPSTSSCPEPRPELLPSLFLSTK